jgi:outer membrane protein assembly factor BamB
MLRPQDRDRHVSDSSPRHRRRAAAIAAALLIAAGLTACDNYFGEGSKKKGPPLSGERISVMLLDQQLKPDESVADVPVRLPRPYENSEWTQPGGNAAHVMGHLAGADDLKPAWSVDIGAGSTDSRSLLSPPVVADGRIFALAADGRLSAYDAASGRQLWDFDTRPPDEKDAIFSGGITTGEGRVFAATGAAEAIAIDAASGKQVWRVRLPSPVRGAPTVADGRLFVVTLDNQAVALGTDDGGRLWSHTGIQEVAALLGGPSPAVGGGAVVVPYSSGDIYVLRAENGRVLWVDNLGRIRPLDAASTLADIRGSPVIDTDLVIAVSHSGRIIATDLQSGNRVWERNLGGVNTPWVAGDFVYVLTLQGELVCLTRREGRVKWVQSLPVFTDPKDREGPIQHSGPLLIGDRLLVTDSEGKVLAISPYTGEILGEVKVGGRIFIPPVAAGGTVYFLGDSGDLSAYR